MPFPVPNATQTQDIFEIAKFVNNEASGGIFFPIMLLVIWAIAFIGSISEGRGALRAWIFANFVCSILAIILALLGFLQATFIYFLVILLAFGVLFAKLQNRGGT